MKIVSSIAELREIRWENAAASWGLVPTMGFLHEGHLELVKRAREENERVGVSIFVNPIQFNNSADLEKYPRDSHRDASLLEAAGVDLLWMPTPDIVYPEGYQTYVDVTRVTRVLEGASRPGHFQGVATVVAKLFNVFQPGRAYFGQKDAQQVVVIRRMVKDLAFNLEVVVCPTVREEDGLAMSSRNVRLSPDHRAQATCLHEALRAAEDALKGGARNAAHLREIMEERIGRASQARIDYVSVADPESLEELTEVHEGALLSMAVYFGQVRLIDNAFVS